MKIGVRAHDFGRHSVEDLPKIIKEAGFDCVQLALAKAIEGINSFADITDRHLEQVFNSFEKNQLDITVLGCYIEPSVSDKDLRLSNVAIFQNHLAYAKTLDVSVVGTETTHMHPTTPEKEREKAYQLLKDSVLRMAETAEKHEVNIGIEPVADHTLNTPILTKRLIDEVGSKRLKIIFDPFNMLLPETAHRQEEIYKEMFDLFSDRIVVLHVKDTIIANGEKTWANIGRGIINYRFIMDFLPSVNLLREDVKMDSYKEDRDAIEKIITYHKKP
ncbi:MAG: sugar phosphate isomerase/epimerase [Defluviitaleaceae bacterium]|nr:sugar phosphate isomerase/epimerase [Defluviitaleaceae bacterium]